MPDNESAKVVINHDHWPLLVAHFPDHALTDEQWREVVTLFNGYGARGEPYVLLVHSEGPAHLPSVTQRALIAELVGEATLEGSLGTVIVTPSAVYRGVAIAVSWFCYGRLRLHFVTSWVQGIARAQKILKQANLEQPNLAELQPITRA